MLKKYILQLCKPSVEKDYLYAGTKFSREYNAILPILRGGINPIPSGSLQKIYDSLYSLEEAEINYKNIGYKPINFERLTSTYGELMYKDVLPHLKTPIALQSDSHSSSTKDSVDKILNAYKPYNNYLSIV